MSRFEHLKSKKKSLNDFIEGANNSSTRKARKRIGSHNVLLSVTGRIKMEDYEKPDLIYMRKDIKADIDKYCAGTRQAVVNYLLRCALDTLIESGEKVMAEVE